MEKLSMCRVCLAEGVRMQPIANTPLQEVFESLNMTPLETKDSRPQQVCYMCSASLHNCHLLRQSCRRSEELLMQMVKSNTLELAQRQETCSISRLQVTAVEHYCVGEVPHGCCAGGAKCEPPEVFVDVVVKSEDAESDNVQNCSPNVSGMTLVEHVHSAESDDDVPLDIVKHELQEDSRVLHTSVSSQSDGAPAATSSAFSDEEREPPPVDRPFYLQCRSCKKSYERRRLDSLACACADSRPHQCRVCQRRFLAEHHLLRHARVHGSERPFGCEECGKKFRLKSNLAAHVKRHNEKPHRCEVCQKRFCSKSHLLSHLRVHDSARPFECEECGRSFKAESNLRAHVRQHSEGKRFECHVCRKRFNYKGNLKKHVQLHTGERPHACECGKRFVTRSALTKHGRTHTRSGEKPYRCELCRETFNYNSNFLKHQRRGCRLGRA